MGRLTGKTAVVTGAGRGIGRGVARMFRAAGAEVLGCDINPDTLATLADEEAGIETLAADLTSEAGAAALAERAGSLFGRVDILVNAAAITRFAPIDEMSLADWDLTLKGEISSVFLVTQALWPLLKQSGRASIVNFGSANAHVALNGLPAIAHTAGKGAVLALTRQLAMEGRLHGIRANTIAPGFIVTEETAQHLDTPLMREVHAKLMLDRLGTPEDVGHLAVYLGSDESTYVTAADFRIDGGSTAW